MNSIKQYMILVRPANIITSVADVAAGVAISGFGMGCFGGGFAIDGPALLLYLSTAALYAGGIVFNDVFDLAIDRVERPERPLPSGRVSVRAAVILGVVLLVIGIGAAWLVSLFSGILAFSIAAMALLYDRFGKHHPFFGPLNMGLCRGLNLLLGISLVPAALNNWYFLSLVPVMYIFSITMVSRGEVHGGRKSTLNIAFILYLLVATAIFICSFINGEALLTMLFIILFGAMIFPPLLKAMQQPVAGNIRKAVKAGVIGLIFMDAAWAAAFHAWQMALIITALFPLSIWLARKFAVT